MFRIRRTRRKKHDRTPVVNRMHWNLAVYDDGFHRMRADWNRGRLFHRTELRIERLSRYMNSSTSQLNAIADPSSQETTAKILLTGIHLEITEALRDITLQKAARLLRRQTDIVRIRISLEHVNNDRAPFIAKGHVELGGPDLLASVASDDGYKSLDLLIDRLDRMLRERTRTSADRRNNRPEGTEFRDCFTTS